MMPTDRGTRRRHLCHWLAAGLLCGAPVFGGHAAAPQPASGPKVDISLKLGKDIFTTGEDIEVQVRVANTGQQPVQIQSPFYRDNWQPVYTLEGPGFPGGQNFSFRSAVVGDKRPNPGDVTPKLVDMAPGRVLQAEIPLHKWVALTEPGRYRLTASLTWGEVKAVSAPVEFTLGQMQLLSLSAGVDVGVAGSRGHWLEWLQGPASAPRLYSALYTPPERDLPGFRPFSISPIANAAVGAGEVLSPWTSYDRMAELYKWRAWRENATVLALLTGASQPQRLDLPVAPAGLIRPALMSRQGELDVFVLASRRELALLRFTPPKRGAPDIPPRIVWQQAMTHDVVGARAAVLPDTPGATRHVLLVAADGDATLVWHVASAMNAAPGAPVPVRIGEVRPLPNSQPALRVDAQGVAHAALLVETSAAPRRLGIVDLDFAADGKLIGTPRVGLLAALASGTHAGTVEFAIGANMPMRRDWAVLLDSGQVLSPGRPSGGTAVPGRPALPLQLLPTAEGTYLLGVDAKSGPSFNLLP